MKFEITTNDNSEKEIVSPEGSILRKLSHDEVMHIGVEDDLTSVKYFGKFYGWYGLVLPIDSLLTLAHELKELHEFLKGGSQSNEL